MPQQVLNDGQRSTVFQEVGGEGVAETVGCDTLGEPGPERGGSAGLLEGGRAQRDLWRPAGKEQG